MEDEVINGSLEHNHHLQHHHKHHHNHHPHHIRHRHISSGEDGVEEEELDPRIQVELEKLNRATEEINRLELELDDARASFRQVLSDSSQRLNGLAKKLGACVDKARPYYDARMKLKEAHLESQKAALRFERACSMHEAAKEMVQLAEEGYKRREEDLDPTWQEMLNHATMKVNDAERERMESEDNHQSTTLNFKKREEEVQKLQRDLKRAITKSKPYFEMKAKFNQVMEDHKRNVSRLEEDVASTKALYSEALRNLEAISDDIHRQRLERRQKMQLGIRGAGVGAESPSPPPLWDKGINIDGSAYPIFGSDEEEDSEGRTVPKSKRRWKDQGIVGYDLPLCVQPDDPGLDTSSMKSDPLNLVIFKTDSHQRHGHDASWPATNSFHSPSVIHPNAKCARSLSYRQAVGHTHNPDADERADSDDMVTRSRHLTGNEDKNVDKGTNTQTRLSSMSPRSIHRSEAEAMQSSLLRAQEWVNKSPVPQQRRFIKSKSLIDASTPLTLASSGVEIRSNFSPPPATPPSLTTDATPTGFLSDSPAQLDDGLTQSPHPSNTATSHSQRSSALSARLSEPQSSPLFHHQQHQVPSQHSPSAPSFRSTSDRGADIQIQPHLHATLFPSPNQTTTLSHPHSKSSPRSVSSTSDQSSPVSGSPSGKSPKLQGLILRVDAAAILNSSTASAVSPASSQGQQMGQHNPVLMSRHISAPGVLTHQHLPSSQGTASGVVTATTTTSKPAVSSSASPPSSFLNTPATSLSVYSTSPSPTQPTVNKTSPSLGGFKLPSYSSKTAPPSAFHLPSPTRNRAGLSTIPPPALRQIVSPTPPSPSGDRVSILSGRSDSSKGGLLRPPSDSSDTESIASTGPMLDDDQVELLTLDFTEQSISSSAQNPAEDGEFMGDNPAHLQRGGWSRMSLPPRLSYLGGYLDRARQMSRPGAVASTDSAETADKRDEDNDVDDLSPQVGDSENPSPDDSETIVENQDIAVTLTLEETEGESTDTEKNPLDANRGVRMVGEESCAVDGNGNTSIDVCVTLGLNEEQERLGDETNNHNVIEDKKDSEQSESPVENPASSPVGSGEEMKDGEDQNLEIAEESKPIETGHEDMECEV